MKVSITVNGNRQENDVEPRTLLVHYLRDTLGLTGTHVGCDTSQCGACTVALNGRIVKSCTIFAVQADGANVLTIEGLAKGDKLHPVQSGFRERHSLQFGERHFHRLDLFERRHGSSGSFFQSVSKPE